MLQRNHNPDIAATSDKHYVHEGNYDTNEVGQATSNTLDIQLSGEEIAKVELEIDKISRFLNVNCNSLTDISDKVLVLFQALDSLIVNHPEPKQILEPTKILPNIDSLTENQKQYLAKFEEFFHEVSADCNSYNRYITLPALLFKFLGIIHLMYRTLR